MQIVAYVAILAVYIAVAVVAWIGCLAAALRPVWRRPARRVALSVAATFPGVFACQALVFPAFCACVALALAVTWPIDSRIHPPVSTASMVIGGVLMLLALALVLAASLYGFYLGWRVAWDVSGGATLSAALDARRPARWLRRRVDAWRGRKRRLPLVPH